MKLRMKSFVALLSLAAFSAAVAVANPVVTGADPDMGVFGNTYWMYPTVPMVKGKAVFKAFSSSDLQHWEDRGVILDLNDVPWVAVPGHAVHSAWAPSILFAKNRYYLYYAVGPQARGNPSRIGVAVAGSTGRVMQLAGIDRMPIESHVLQAFVTESLKPFLDTVVTFGMGHCYINQSDKGGLVYGGDIDGYNSYAQRGNLPIVEDVMSEMLAMFPSLGGVRLLRSWGGVCDMSMDGSPVITKGPLPGMYLNCGWCYGGFKATPASGFCFAHTIARDEPHEFNAAFTLDRFNRGILIDEKGQGATSRLH